MSITERTLRKWRKEALRLGKDAQDSLPNGDAKSVAIEINSRILKMTQELLDQHLLRRKK